jgi:hypothetical protein
MNKLTWKQFFRKIKPVWPPNIFGKQKLLMALEFGVAISESAKSLNVEVTPEMIKNAEYLLLEECRTGTAEKFACNMIAYVLAVLQPKEIIKH